MYTGPIIDGISELHLLPSMSSSLRCIIQGLMVATYFHPYSFPLNVKNTNTNTNAYDLGTKRFSGSGRCGDSVVCSNWAI